MENKKTKNHKENWIGNIIRGFLLFMPLLAIGVTCAYAIFNKNAYQSYYGETINDKELVQIDDVTTYTGEIVFDVDTTIQYENIIGYNYFNVDNFNSEITDINNEQVKKIAMYSAVYQTDYNMWVSLRDTNGNVLKNINGATSSIYFTCDIVDYSKSSNSTIIGNFANYFFKFKYNNLSYVSEVFYYSIDKVQQSPLFNWAEETGMYNVIHGACTTLGIQTTFVPFLLSYWLLTYLIYILYDIALLIVNMAHNRIHNVESSI